MTIKHILKDGDVAGNTLAQRQLRQIIRDHFATTTTPPPTPPVANSAENNDEDPSDTEQVWYYRPDGDWEVTKQEDAEPETIAPPTPAPETSTSLTFEAVIPDNLTAGDLFQAVIPNGRKFHVINAYTHFY